MHYHAMRLSVTLRYSMMVYSQVFRVYRHVISTELYRNARKSTNPIQVSFGIPAVPILIPGLGYLLHRCSLVMLHSYSTSRAVNLGYNVMGLGGYIY